MWHPCPLWKSHLLYKGHPPLHEVATSYLCRHLCSWGPLLSAQGQELPLTERLDEIARIAASFHLTADESSIGQQVLNSHAQTFDPDASVMTEEELSAFMDQRKGRAHGFGFMFGSTGSRFKVTGILEDAPGANTVPESATLTAIGTNSLSSASFGTLQTLIDQSGTDPISLTYETDDGTTNSVEATAGDIQRPTIALAEELPEKPGLPPIKRTVCRIGAGTVVSKIRSWSETGHYGLILDLRPRWRRRRRGGPKCGQPVCIRRSLPVCVSRWTGSGFIHL